MRGGARFVRAFLLDDNLQTKRLGNSLGVVAWQALAFFPPLTKLRAREGLEVPHSRRGSLASAGSSLFEDQTQILNTGEGLELSLADPLGVASVSHRNPQGHHRADTSDDGQGHGGLRHGFNALVDASRAGGHAYGAKLNDMRETK